MTYPDKLNYFHNTSDVRKSNNIISTTIRGNDNLFRTFTLTNNT